MMMTLLMADNRSMMMWCAEVERLNSVAQGAVENLTSALSDLSLKDSAKSDSTGGDRLADSITPTSSVNCTVSDDTAAKPSPQQPARVKSDDKVETVSVKSTPAEGSTKISVVSLLHGGQTLRYSVCFVFNLILKCSEFDHTLQTEMRYANLCIFSSKIKYAYTSVCILMAIFPTEPGLAGFCWSSGGGEWWPLELSSCKAPVKSSPPTNQHPVFLHAWCHSCLPTNSVKALKGKNKNKIIKNTTESESLKIIKREATK